MTATPTKMLTTIVRVAKTVPVFGKFNPIAVNNASSAFAIPRPRKSPAKEANRPIASASSMTLRKTCRREPPIVLNVANSRMRWAIVIESVFAMTNAPTKSARTPNASRTFWKMPSVPLTSSTASCVCTAAVFACAVGGKSGRIWLTSASGVTPGFAATWT